MFNPSQNYGRDIKKSSTVRVLNFYCHNCKSFMDQAKDETGNWCCLKCGEIRIYKSRKGEFEVK